LVKISLTVQKNYSNFDPSSHFPTVAKHNGLFKWLFFNNYSTIMARFNFSKSINSSGIVNIPGISFPLTLLCGIFLLYSCIKDPTIPVLKTNPVLDITTNSVTIGGDITDDGGSPVTVRGVCWGTSLNPSFEGLHTTDGEGSGAFSTIITGLLPNTQYHARAYAENSIGIAYGNDILFTTGIEAPVVITTGITDITDNTAMSGGKITYDGGAAITAKGICWSTSTEPDITDSFTTNGTDTSRYQSQMTGLLPGTKYYARAYAKNSAWTVYGEEVAFITKLADVEGNLYNTVIIGTQVWMAENLRTTKYNNNIAIPNVANNTSWANLSTAAYCWYNNDIAYKPTFGALYNWYAINAGDLCPTGWHVPTDEEFNALEVSLGMASDQVDVWGWRGTDQGTQMKDISGWDTGGNGTNSSGFTALPGGYRYGATGAFYLLTSITYWWNSTEHDADRGWYRRLDSSRSDIYKASTSKKGGKYIRCLKN
jgi:uncharacterized protein (TIGR02145 family)